MTSTLCKQTQNYILRENGGISSRVEPYTTHKKSSITSDNLIMSGASVGNLICRRHKYSMLALEGMPRSK